MPFSKQHFFPLCFFFFFFFLFLTTSFFTTPLELVSSIIQSSCQIFKIPLLPVSSPLAVDLNDQDFWFKWDSPDSRDSERNRSLCGFINNTTFQVTSFTSLKSGLYNFILLVLKLICLSFLIALLATLTTCVAYVMFSHEWVPTMIRRRFLEQLVAREQCTGDAESNIIELYKKVELEENMKPLGKNDVICSICLSEYAKNETVGCLLGCDHCFHIECIDKWLRFHRSCPICRNCVFQQCQVCDSRTL